MAEIDKKFILAKQKSTFENRLESGDVKDTSIAFIEDSEQIWTQGNYYTCVPSDGTNGQVLKKTSNGPEWQNETTYTEASSVKSGLMSATDKIKLDGIDINANKYVLPVATSSSLGGVKSGADIVVGGDGSVTVNNKVIPRMYKMGVYSKYKLFSILNSGDKASTTFSILSPVLSSGLGYAKYIAYRPYEGTTIKNWSIRCIYATDSSMYNRIKLVRTGDATFDVYYQSNTGNDYCTFILDETTSTDLEIVAAGVSSIPEDIYKESEYAPVYLGDIYGSLKGNADTATKATQDGNGNNIVSTYATKDIATTSKSGLMSNTDKSKLDGIAANANNYSLPTASNTTLGGIKVGSGLSISGGVLSATGGGEADSVEWENVLNKPGNVTTSTDGLMSSEDKIKLDNIQEGYIAFVNSSDAINIDNYPQSDYGTIAIWFNQAEADGTPPGQEGIVFQTKYKSEQGDSGSGYINCISQLYFGSDGVKQRSTIDYDAANPFDGIAWTSTTYSIATTSANGLMSSLDKKKLDVLNQNNVTSSSADGYPAILLGGGSTINNSNQSTYISAGTLSSSGNGSYIRTGTSKRTPLELKTYGQQNYINIETENYTNPGFNQTSAPITLTCGAGGQILLNTSDTSKQGIVDIHGSLVIEDGNSNRVLLQAKSSQTLQVGTNLTVAGTITGSHMYKSSDARLKENVIPVSADKYQLADQLQIKEFDFIETKKHSVGLIAQDVEQVLPDIVNTNEEGYKSIDYIEYLLLKVQALEERIKQLENK